MQVLGISNRCLFLSSKCTRFLTENGKKIETIEELSFCLCYVSHPTVRCVFECENIYYTHHLWIYTIWVGLLVSIFISVSHSNKYIITWLHKLSFWLSYLAFCVLFVNYYESGVFDTTQILYEMCMHVENSNLKCSILNFFLLIPHPLQ